MHDAAENIAKLKDACRRWNDSKGTDITMWTALFADHARLRSLAAGRPGLEFTLECRSTNDLARYFEGLLGEWEMLHYTTEQFAAEGDRVVMLGSTSWRNRKTGRVFETPKADLITFRDGRIVDFYEFYDTESILCATQR